MAKTATARRPSTAKSRGFVVRRRGHDHERRRGRRGSFRHRSRAPRTLTAGCMGRRVKLLSASSPRYLAGVLRNSFQSSARYRSAVFVTVINNLFFGILRALVLIGLFAQARAGAVAGYSLRQVLTYTAF